MTPAYVSLPERLVVLTIVAVVAMFMLLAYACGQWSRADRAADGWRRERDAAVWRLNRVVQGCAQDAAGAAICKPGSFGTTTTVVVAK